MSTRLDALRRLSGDGDLKLYVSGTVAQTVGGLRAHQVSRRSQHSMRALGCPGHWQRTRFRLQMLHGVIMDCHPSLLSCGIWCRSTPSLSTITFLRTKCRDSVEHCKRQAMVPSNTREDSQFMKSEGELNVMPQLFPKCFIMALSLAKTIAPSWVKL